MQQYVIAKKAVSERHVLALKNKIHVEAIVNATIKRVEISNVGDTHWIILMISFYFVQLFHTKF